MWSRPEELTQERRSEIEAILEEVSGRVLAPAGAGVVVWAT
jgi:hypothetical protein